MCDIEGETRAPWEICVGVSGASVCKRQHGANHHTNESSSIPFAAEFRQEALCCNYEKRGFSIGCAKACMKIKEKYYTGLINVFFYLCHTASGLVIVGPGLIRLHFRLQSCSQT